MWPLPWEELQAPVTGLTVPCRPHRAPHYLLGGTGSAPHLQPPCKAAPSVGGSGARAAPGAAQRGPYSGSAAGVRWRGAQLYFYSLVSALINIPSHGSRGPGQNRREPRRGQAWRQMSPRHAWVRRLPAAPLLGEQTPASPRPAASHRAGGEGSRGRPRLAAINKSKKPA